MRVDDTHKMLAITKVLSSSIRQLPEGALMNAEHCARFSTARRSAKNGARTLHIYDH